MRWFCLVGLAWLGLATGAASADAGFIHAGSDENATWLQQEQSTSASSAIPVEVKQKPVHRPFLTFQLLQEHLRGDTTTSTSSPTNTTSSDTLPAALPLPMDEPPPLCSRYCLLHSVLSSQLFPSGLFRPPRLV